MRAYSAAIILIGLWLALLGMDALTTYVASTYPEHDIPWTIEWLEGVFENLQSEAWQVAVAAWVFKHFFWKGSPESKDTDGA